MRTTVLERKATSKSYKIYVALVVTINIVPHCFYLPAWLIIIASVFIIWSILNIYRNVKLPSVFFRNLLVLGSSGFIFMNYKTLFGAEPAAAIFVIVAAVKLVDFTKYRDGMTEIILCYFLLLTQLLHSQSLGSTLFFTVDVFIITTLMHQLHKNDRRQSIRTFLPSLKLLFLSIPIWIFLFLVFPRFGASFMHMKPSQASMGFSPKLMPGSVGQLLQSDETAFRVKFDREVSGDRLYFRGAILSKTEGLTWSKSAIDNDVEKISSYKRDQTLNLIKQEYVIEPNFQRFLFALDFPIRVSTADPGDVVKKSGSVFELRSPLQNRGIYFVDSIDSNLDGLSTQERTVYTEKPHVSEKVLALAHYLSAGATTSRQKISHILNYFSSQKFAYTLEPGEMKGDGLTVFLFEKKIGFCEHYAASLSTIARLMGVPSRVVIGFQGGKYNDLTGYYIVKSLDAHAWSEVWYEEERRWMRVDPTVVVAPIRVSYGAEAYRQGSTSFAEAQDSLTNTLSNNIFFAFDAVTTKWNNFLLKYDFEYQNKLLEGLGFASASRMTLFILLFVGLAALTASLKIYYSSQKAKVDPTLSLYRLFCKKLERLGVVRLRNEGPETFRKRVLLEMKHKKEEADLILRSFIDIRYRQTATPGDLRVFKKQIRKF